VICVKKLPRFVAHTNASWPALDGSEMIQTMSKTTMIQPTIFDSKRFPPGMAKNLSFR
jgi:hypothetical protein